MNAISGTSTNGSIELIFFFFLKQPIIKRLHLRNRGAVYFRFEEAFMMQRGGQSEIVCHRTSAFGLKAISDKLSIVVVLLHRGRFS